MFVKVKMNIQSKYASKFDCFRDSLFVGQVCHLLSLVINVYGFCIYFIRTGGWLLRFLENVDFTGVTPKGISLWILSFDEFIIGDVSREKGVLVVFVGAFSYVSETGPEFVFGIFPRDESAVSRHLSSRVWNVHY